MNLLKVGYKQKAGKRRKRKKVCYYNGPLCWMHAELLRQKSLKEIIKKFNKKIKKNVIKKNILKNKE